MKDIRALFKRMMELCQPDLRKYYRMPRKGRIHAAYASAGGQWYADVQPLRNDESPDPDEPILPKLELPVIWGDDQRGVVCPPAAGTYCTVGYWDGDPSYPYILNIRWYAQNPPEAELTEFIIQQQPGVHIKIDKTHKVITVTPANIEDEAGKDWTVDVGQNATITVGQNATIEAGSVATVKAPQINLIGNLTTTGAGGSMATTREKGNRNHEGSYQLTGPQTISGNLVVSGTVTAGQFVGPVAGCSGCG